VARVRNASWKDCGKCRAPRWNVSEYNRIVPVPAQILNASRRDFDFLALNGSLYGHRFLFLNHQSVRIPNVVFQLGKRSALAKNTRYLRQAAYEPGAIFPIFKLKSK
jgi:hypothetical protein